MTRHSYIYRKLELISSYFSMDQVGYNLSTSYLVFSRSFTLNPPEFASKMVYIRFCATSSSVLSFSQLTSSKRINLLAQISQIFNFYHVIVAQHHNSLSLDTYYVTWHILQNHLALTRFYCHSVSTKFYCHLASTKFYCHSASTLKLLGFY